MASRNKELTIAIIRMKKLKENPENSKSSSVVVFDFINKNF